MEHKQWAIAQPEQARVCALMQQGGYSLLAALALVARGIDTPEQAARHLHSDPSGLHDPFLLKDMDLAVALVRHAIEHREAVAIYGDYDVDGLTATCMLVDYLRNRAVPCDYTIPNPFHKGDGPDNTALERFYQQGVQLIITVDSGITAYQEVAAARKLGMKVLITDHHECHATLPEAHAIINTKRPDCTYPFPLLAGVGIAFKLLCALDGDPLPLLERYADFLALGTVADVMPMTGENRIFVAAGLKKMGRNANIGVEALLRVAGLKKKRLTTAAISYTLAPRINAAGRLGNAELAAELLLTADSKQAKTLAMRLCELNKQRQREENVIFEQTLRQIQDEYNPLMDSLIILTGTKWRHGLIGSVCARLCSRFQCPVLLLAQGENGSVKGSARSVPGFNWFDALRHCRDLLQQYGGHELAAGMTLDSRHIPALCTRLRAYAKEKLHVDDMPSCQRIDSLVSPSWLTVAHVEALRQLEPYGMHNAEPVFGMTSVTVEDITPITSDKHVRLLLAKDNLSFSALLFGAGRGGLGFAPGNIIDVAFRLELQEVHGQRRVQLLLCDVRLNECEKQADEKLLAIYQTYIADGPLTAWEARMLLPERMDLVAVWRHIVCRSANEKLTAPASALSRRIAWENQRQLNIGQLLVCLDIFSESKLLNYHCKEGIIYLELKPHQGKADVSGSVILATLQSMACSASHLEQLQQLRQTKRKELKG